MISEYYYYYIIIYIVESFGENMTTLRKVKLSKESCVTYACIFPDHYAPCLSCLYSHWHLPTPVKAADLWFCSILTFTNTFSLKRGY